MPVHETAFLPRRAAWPLEPATQEPPRYHRSSLPNQRSASPALSLQLEPTYQSRHRSWLEPTQEPPRYHRSSLPNQRSASPALSLQLEPTHQSRHRSWLEPTHQEPPRYHRSSLPNQRSASPALSLQLETPARAEWVSLQQQAHGHRADTAMRRSYSLNAAQIRLASAQAQTRCSPQKHVSCSQEAPNKPLPPLPEARVAPQRRANPMLHRESVRWQQHMPRSALGREAGEVQTYIYKDDEWSSADGKSRGQLQDSAPPGGGRDDEVRRSGGARRREDQQRRHTLAGEQQAASSSLSRSMELEMGPSKSRSKKSPAGSLQRSFYHQPVASSMFDDDPGIMSEVETASTGFRRGGKQRSSLPVVRTPSKTLERPLGLVFLQYRNETKRALLPNEITSIDTVKALFVRSFPKQLTMEYLDSPVVKIYIHDSSKDMFYELEDLRSHLRDIRDRSVLRLFESPDINGSGGVSVGGAPLPGGLPPHPSPSSWDQDQSYFSEPEFDSEFQHQHIHKTKGSGKQSGGNNSPYYMAHSYPPGPPTGSATLPRGAPPVIRAYSPLTKSGAQSGVPSPVSPPRPPQRWVQRPRGVQGSAERLHSDAGYMSSPERGRPPGYAAYPAAGAYEDPYYAQYRSGSITPVIDEEASDSDELLMDPYALYGSAKVAGGPRLLQASPQQPQQPPQPPAPARPAFPATAAQPGTLVPYDATRIRVEHMERQLANLTGLVQKALTQGPRDLLQVPGSQAYRADDYDKTSSSSSASLPDESYLRPEPAPKHPKLGKDKSVSFEKSVSFSDDPPDMLSSPKQHTPQHSADTKPTKPAIKSSTLPRTSSQERDRHKPAPPPKPMSLAPHQAATQYEAGRHLYRADLQPETYNQLRVLQKKAKDLRQEVRNLRRMSQAQAHSVREAIRDTFIKIRAMLLTGGGDSWLASGDTEKLRVSREEELYKQEMLRLEKDLTELEGTVEDLRGNVINKKTRVNMSDVENMALVLSKSSKTVADLKVRFPSLQDGMKSLLSAEMEKVVREEKFLKDEPERLESALRRCKKLTGTLVTLKRLASVQEQRLPVVQTPNAEQQPDTLQPEPPAAAPQAVSPQSKCPGDPARGLVAPGAPGDAAKRPENALDSLLDELQTFARPPAERHGSVDTPPPPPPGTLRRLHSYPSSDSASPVRAPRGAEEPSPPLPERSKVPPPPPPRTSSRSPLVSPTSPPRLAPRGTLGRRKPKEPPQEPPEPGKPPLSSNSSSSESINSQEGLRGSEALEQRHQELLRRQRQLQEQYARLQQLQRTVRLPPTPELKKTGSESNLLRGLNLSAAPVMSGSLTHLAPANLAPIVLPAPPTHSGSSKIYETDIL